jgi:nitroreductase
MNTLDAIRQRRAIKHFDPAHQFTKEETQQLIELAMQAPSSFNIQHWRLVNVTDKALRAELRAAAHDQAQVTDASLLFVIAVDIKAWSKDPARYWINAPKEAQDILVPWINPFYSSDEQLQRDEGMGYDSCPMVGFDFKKVAELIHLPKDFALAAMLPIGKAVKPAWPKPGFIPQSEMIVENHF